MSATRPEHDVLIVGAGFAGSLLAQVLRRLGLSVVLIDKLRHPRFAVGESSTPLADFMLEHLAEEFDLPHLKPLARYGSWRDELPELRRGLKRGFSYFQHLEGQPFTADPGHARQLLVAASADDRSADTHWLRADVDHWMARSAVGFGAELLEETTLTELTAATNGWDVELQTRGLSPRRLRCSFVVDASGGAVVAKRLGVESGPTCRTNTASIFTHLWGVAAWSDTYAGGPLDALDHPFPSDDAAQHHLIDGGWVWLLRFDDGMTSVGIVVDQHRRSLGDGATAEIKWRSWMDRYPSINRLFDQAWLADVPGGWLEMGRLQRRLASASGAGWLALPNTAGFIDPLHSTGIAHSLWGIARCGRIFRDHWKRPSLSVELSRYDRIVRREIDWIDRIISACYAVQPSFALFADACMTYFVAATTLEHRMHERRHRDALPAFLCADDLVLRQAARRLEQARPDPATADAEALQAHRRLVQRELGPFDRVGLCDPAANNMYRYTTAPHKAG